MRRKWRHPNQAPAAASVRALSTTQSAAARVTLLRVEPAGHRPSEKRGHHSAARLPLLKDRLLSGPSLPGGTADRRASHRERDELSVQFRVQPVVRRTARDDTGSMRPRLDTKLRPEPSWGDYLTTVHKGCRELEHFRLT